MFKAVADAIAKCCCGKGGGGGVKLLIIKWRVVNTDIVHLKKMT